MRVSKSEGGSEGVREGVRVREGEELDSQL